MARKQGETMQKINLDRKHRLKEINGLETFMMGEQPIETMKWKHIFKKTVFWLGFFLYAFIYSIVINIKYVSVSLAEYVGVFLGSFVVVTFVFSLFYMLSKIRSWRKK